MIHVKPQKSLINIFHWLSTVYYRQSYKSNRKRRQKILDSEKLTSHNVR